MTEDFPAEQARFLAEFDFLTAELTLLLRERRLHEAKVREAEVLWWAEAKSRLDRNFCETERVVHELIETGTDPALITPVLDRIARMRAGISKPSNTPDTLPLFGAEGNQPANGEAS